MSRNRGITRTIKNNIGAGAVMPQIELFGDWALTQRVLSTIDGTLTVAMKLANKSIADKIRYQVRKNIRENGGSISPAWAPLGVDYQLKKAKKGYDPDRRLYASGVYYNSIRIWNQGGTRYYVGVKRGIQHKDGGRTVGAIARMLEDGGPYFPARPLWAPSYRQFGGHKRVRGLVLWHIRNQIYRNYNIRPTINI